MGIDERIAALYGDAAPAELARAEGLIHVAAIAAARTDPQWPAILIRPTSPRSAADRFALELARARADAIVIGGQIVRDEPELRYGRPGEGLDYAGELLDWREQSLAKSDPPRLLILTRSARFDFAHPVWRSWARPTIFTTLERAQSLGTELARHELGSSVDLAGHRSPSLDAALGFLRETGAKTISLEAGPSLVGPLYARPNPPLDELMLSFFDGPLAPELRGPDFAEAAQVERHFEGLSAVVGDASEAGRWTLTRWRVAS